MNFVLVTELASNIYNIVQFPFYFLKESSIFETSLDHPFFTFELEEEEQKKKDIGKAFQDDDGLGTGFSVKQTDAGSTYSDVE